MYRELFTPVIQNNGMTFMFAMDVKQKKQLGE